MNLSWMKVGDIIKMDHRVTQYGKFHYKILHIVRKAWDPYIVVVIEQPFYANGLTSEFTFQELYDYKPMKVFINNYKRSGYEFKYSDNR